ncbi:hypothetical protein Landi51_05868 [Colletotrichum acutatum]
MNQGSSSAMLREEEEEEEEEHDCASKFGSWSDGNWQRSVEGWGEQGEQGEEVRMVKLGVSGGDRLCELLPGASPESRGAKQSSPLPALLTPHPPPSLLPLAVALSLALAVAVAVALLAPPRYLPAPARPPQVVNCFPVTPPPS